jgi:hypothetical protein
MTRYQVDTRNQEMETSLNIFRALFRWAAERGDRFELLCETGVYDDPQQVERLRALGETTMAMGSGNALERLFARVFDKGCILIRGTPGPNLIPEITNNVAPERAISGDESPVESIVIYRGKQDLYVSYDYGTVQIVNLTDLEKAEVTKQFGGLGLTAERLRQIKEERQT